MTIYTLALIYAIFVVLLFSPYVIADIDQRKYSKRENNITLDNALEQDMLDTMKEQLDTMKQDMLDAMKEQLETNKNKVCDFSLIIGKDTKKTLIEKGFNIYNTKFDYLYIIQKDNNEAIVWFDENDVLIKVDKELWESMSDAGKNAFLTIDK